MRGGSVEVAPWQEATRLCKMACQPSPQSSIRLHLPQVIERYEGAMREVDIAPDLCRGRSGLL